ncbi:MAG TPA: TldD/PmbA family protein [Azospirillaceae bacterium]|nr:TldD/PmbA family protein [Azospirillaceae bacterium]
MTHSLDLLSDLIRRAKAAGADAADAVAYESASVSVTRRFGKTEKLERSESADLGLRVFVGKGQAIVSSTDRADETLAQLAERAVAMARLSPEDPYAGIADPDQIVREWSDMDVCDPVEPAVEALIEDANTAEAAALAVAGVTNSEGGDASWSRSDIWLAASNGFSGGYAVSRRSISASVLAGEGLGMERDYDYDSKVYGEDLRAAADIGAEAGRRAVRRLNPRKVKSCQVPVVFDPRQSRALLSNLISAISGPSVARGTSFLKDKLGQRIFPESVNVIDDPFVRRGLRSRPFDSEGLAVSRRALIENGVLTTWLLDLRSARQLGLNSTGHAARGASGPPGPAPANVWMEPGKVSVKDLIADIREGFYVVETMGMGVNGVTGDYSKGAAGYWIENGEIAYPVSEITIASNLNDMMLNLTAADDLEMRYGVDAPTLRIEGMTVAGS